MRKLVLGLLVLAAASCDSKRRDFTYCDDTYSCKWGYSCQAGLCVLGDAGTDVAAPAVDAQVVADSSPIDSAADLAIDSPADLSVEATPIDGAKDLPQIEDTAISIDQVDQAAVDVTLAIDGSPADAPKPVDSAVPDTRIPDAGGTCSTDNDCVSVAKSPYCVGYRCVSCAAAVADGGGVCSGKTPACNADTGACVECLANSQCTKDASKGFCAQSGQNKYTCVGCDDPGALASSGGADGGSGDGGTTLATTACVGSTSLCMLSTSGNAKAGQCVGCRADADCTSPNAPVCDTAKTFTCGPCTSDSQCTSGPGICMYVKDGIFQHEGRCATDAETLYVQNSAGCSGGSGTFGSPFCQPQSALSAVTTSKRVVVMSGTAPLAVWSATLGSGSQPVYAFGKGNPIVAVGAADMGVHIVSGSVYLRGVTVQGSGATALNPGVVVESGAILGLNRCYVMNNAGGLLANDGSGFDIGNNVFAQNQTGSAGAAVFGGAFLGTSTDATLPHRFWFNTIAANNQIGIACSSRQQIIDGSLLSNDIGGEVANCTLAATTLSSTLSPTGHAGTGFSPSNDANTPLFSTTSPYHLTATASRSTSSPCKDRISDPTIPFPPDDVDGQTRPYNTYVDCGADEYWPQ